MFRMLQRQKTIDWNFSIKYEMKNPNEDKYKLRLLIRTHVRSYKWAFRGLLSIFLQQFNFQIELAISAIVIIAGLYFQISRIEGVIVIFCIFLVLVAEALNSAIEAISDAVDRERHQDIRYAKDVGAGAVMLAVIAAGIVGILIFLPYVQDKLTFL